MKTAGFLALVLLAFAANGFAAGSEAIIKQKAKDIRDQNNTRQGVPPAPSPARSATPQTYTPVPAAPAGPSAAQKRLETNLAALTAGAAVSEAQKKALADDLAALAQGPKPGEAAVLRLAAELAAGFAEKPLTSTRRGRLVTTLNQVFNSRKVSAAQLDEYLSDIRFLFQAEGLPREKASKISEAARAVAQP
jgi:hypothetical protein